MEKYSFSSQDVLSFLQQTQKAGIKIWLDGGWGVDALLGRQTRSHQDLDIVIQEKDVPLARELLTTQGYQDVPRDDTSAWNFVMGDESGRTIDFHVVIFDDLGDGIYGPVSNNEKFPRDSFNDLGMIDGQEVPCLTAEFQVKSHSGYELKEKDYQDVRLLCEKYGITNPHY